MNIWDRWLGTMRKAVEMPSLPVENIEPALQSEYDPVLDFSHTVHSTLNVDRVLDLLLASALELTEMDRGFISLEQDGEMRHRFGRDKRGKAVAEAEFGECADLVSRAVSNRDLTTRVSETPVAGTISALCVPLLTYRSLRGGEEAARIAGVLFMDCRKPVPFTALKGKMVKFLALHGGLALENATLFELASVDPLTQLLSRVAFDQLAPREWQRAAFHKRHLSALMLEVDCFDIMGHKFGHAEADRVLQEIAWIVRKSCRHEDLVCRYAGEQVLILLADTPLSGAVALAVRLNATVPMSVNDPTGKGVTISVGVSSHRECRPTSFEDLIGQVEGALYQAKKRGGNDFCQARH